MYSCFHSSQFFTFSHFSGFAISTPAVAVFYIAFSASPIWCIQRVGETFLTRKLCYCKDDRAMRRCQNIPLVFLSPQFLLSNVVLCWHFCDKNMPIVVLPCQTERRCINYPLLLFLYWVARSKALSVLFLLFTCNFHTHHAIKCKCVATVSRM